MRRVQVSRVCVYDDMRCVSRVVQLVVDSVIGYLQIKKERREFAWFYYRILIYFEYACVYYLITPTNKRFRNLMSSMCASISHPRNMKIQSKYQYS